MGELAPARLEEPFLGELAAARPGDPQPGRPELILTLEADLQILVARLARPSSSELGETAEVTASSLSSTQLNIYQPSLHFHPSSSTPPSTIPPPSAYLTILPGEAVLS